MAGLLPPHRGDVTVDGETLSPSLDQRSKEELRKIQFVYQMADTALNPRQKIKGNAVVETFFKTIKAQLIRRNKWQTRQQVTDALFQFINGFYNSRRRHSAIGGMSPIKFERKASSMRTGCGIK
ncbi:MAG: IS3 family transposase [Rhizobiaceae bacterium]|nr:IS3 family transposase [Rhizobiaceae bacterium]